jgi:hypothetical protein
MRPSWVPRDVAYLSRRGFESLIAVTVATSVAKVAVEVASGWARVAAWQPINALDELVIRCQRRARLVLAVAAVKRTSAALHASSVVCIQRMLRGYLARRRSSRRRAAVRVVVQCVAWHGGSDGTHVPVAARGSAGAEACKETGRPVRVRSPADTRRARRKREQRRRKQRARRAMSRGEGQQVLQNEARSLGSVQSSSEVQALSGADGVSTASAVGSVECSRMDRLQNRNYQSRQSAEPPLLQVGGAECQAAQVVLASGRASSGGGVGQ